MIVIKKITVKYSAEEDRLALATQSADGDSLLFWMTNRLAMRVVNALVGKLDPSPQSVVANKLNPPVKQQAIREWEQSAARHAMKPAPEVKIKPAARQLLINSVDINQSNDSFRVIFRWTKEDGARLILSTVEMRQLLQILHQTFKKAGWTMDVWPKWYDLQQSDKEQPRPMVLH